MKEDFRERDIVTQYMKFIREEMKARGYRNASPDNVWEFDYSIFEKATPVSTRYVDVLETHYKYEVKVYKDIEPYQGKTFIVLTEYYCIRQNQKEKLPLSVTLYTNLPINEEYEKDQSSLCECVVCKKQFPKKGLLNSWHGLTCKSCFIKSIREK